MKFEPSSGSGCDAMSQGGTSRPRRRPPAQPQRLPAPFAGRGHVCTLPGRVPI